MKKVFLIIAITLFSLITFSQGLILENKINTNNLIGYWEPDQESAQLFFWKDADGKLQVQEISGTSGEPIDIITLKIENNSVFIKTIFIPNKWIVSSVYTFIDKQALKCEVTGDAETTIIYKKKK
tara:strand:+ start:200 stop:574 length:375 start_codon:yes stop_codon:yes gene_type:complete